MPSAPADGDVGVGAGPGESSTSGEVAELSHADAIKEVRALQGRVAELGATGQELRQEAFRQHGTIDALRGVGGASAGPLSGHEPSEAKLLRLRREAASLEAKSEAMRQKNRRLLVLLAESSGASPFPPGRPDPSGGRSRGDGSGGEGPRLSRSPSQSRDRSRLPSRGRCRSPCRSPPAPATQRKVVSEAAALQATKSEAALQRLAPACSSLWRCGDIQSLFGVFVSSVHRILGDNASIPLETQAPQGKRHRVMLFAADASLRFALAGVALKIHRVRLEAIDKHGYMPPTLHGPNVFFLTGRVPVHGFRRHKSQLAEAPIFKELSALPMSTRTTLAVPLQAGGRMFAALQVTLKGASGSVLDGDQRLSVQLLCSTCAIIVEMLLRIGSAQALQLRLGGFLSFVTDVSTAANLADLVRRVQRKIIDFFEAASTAQVQWYEAKDKTLLASWKNLGSMEAKLSVKPRGTVIAPGGDDSKRNKSIAPDLLVPEAWKRIVRVEPIPGLTGRAAVMAGPLLAPPFAGSGAQLLGVLRVVGHVGDKSVGGFSDVDERIFAEMLRVASLTVHGMSRELTAKEMQANVVERRDIITLERLLRNI